MLKPSATTANAGLSLRFSKSITIISNSGLPLRVSWRTSCSHIISGISSPRKLLLSHSRRWKANEQTINTIRWIDTLATYKHSRLPIDHRKVLANEVSKLTTNLSLEGRAPFPKVDFSRCLPPEKLFLFPLRAYCNCSCSLDEVNLNSMIETAVSTSRRWTQFHKHVIFIEQVLCGLNDLLNHAKEICFVKFFTISLSFPAANQKLSRL